jgi:Ni2+-binding GTPase involved in maturation of urease and hydrogenase
MRGEKPAMFTNLRKSKGLEDVISWIRRELLFEDTNRAN